MKILVACEESQAVTIELRRLGHEAYSCDIEPCSGGHPEWHIQGDVLPLLNGDCTFATSDGQVYTVVGAWDLLIAFPPCTYLTCTGNKWFKPEYRDRFPTREQDREDAVRFFMAFADANCPGIAIENPVGVMSTRWRKPDQIIQPYQFGHTEKKTTCLWLKGLPELVPTEVVEPKLYRTAKGKYEPQWHMDTMKLPAKERSAVRSKTFPGIAHAMAEQWAGKCEEAHCHQPQTAAPVICSECYEKLIAENAELKRRLAAAVERTKKLCYLEYYGRCETDEKPCDGCVERWRGPQEAGEGGG